MINQGLVVHCASKLSLCTGNGRLYHWQNGAGTHDSKMIRRERYHYIRQQLELATNRYHQFALFPHE